MFKHKNTGKKYVEQSDFMQAATLQISDRREKPLVIYCNSFHQAADLLKKLCTAACSWGLLLPLKWYIHILSWGSSAGHSPRQRGTLLLRAPQGKWVPGSRGSLSSCFLCLEEARGSETRLPVTLNYLPECDCACWEGRSRLCECRCVHMKYIYAGFCFKHIFVSQGLIFICCVSTQWQCSAEKLTQVILVCPFKESAP